MKIKDVYVGQEVAMGHSPHTRLGIIVGITKKMVDVRVGNTQHVATYGTKVLVEFVPSRAGTIKR